MEGVSLSALSEPVMSIGSALAPVIKKLRAERRAADSARIDTQLLEGLLDDTLSRLHNIAAHDVWWRDLLRRAASQYVRPEYLEKPAIREWLSESAVRDDLKLLTRIQLLPGASEEASIKARLADRYSAYTGEAAPLAAGPVDAIVNILLAGALAPASKSDLLLAGLVQESAKRTTVQLSRIEEKLGALTGDRIVEDAHTEKATSALTLILRRRSLPLVDSLAEIAVLAERIEGEGELRFCAPGARSQVYLWAARFCSQWKDKVDLARQYRAKALAIGPAVDTKVVDAWLSVCEDDFVGGLSSLRHVNTADARSNTFSMLLKRDGRDRALAWLDANSPTDPTFFTPLGWKNAAIALSEADRWEDAAACLAALPPDATEECPDIPYVDGAINAALTLPAAARRFALTMHIIAMPIEPLQGAEAAARRQRALRSFASAKQALSSVGERIRAALAETWRAWLLLTDPSTRQEGERIVIQAMRDGETAVDYAQLAYTFRIPFDPAPFERHLNIRELAGGLSPVETAAKLVLYRQTRTKAEVVEFLEKGRASLSSVMTPAGYNFLLANALLNAGQLERAQEILHDNWDEFGDDFDRIQDQIRARHGEDISRSVEDRFLATDVLAAS